MAATQCAICLEDEPGAAGGPPRAAMPCCAREAATIAYCVPCVRIICERAPGGVGQCPTCRSHVRVDDSGEVHPAVRRDRCRLCRQNRVIADESCCGPCLLGMRLPLRYECERCHGLQKIAHPMWRYQEAVDAFGNDTWACHGRCGDFTKWRVYAADAGLIPPEVSHSPSGIN